MIRWRSDNFSAIALLSSMRRIILIAIMSMFLAVELIPGIAWAGARNIEIVPFEVRAGQYITINGTEFIPYDNVILSWCFNEKPFAGVHLSKNDVAFSLKDVHVPSDAPVGPTCVHQKTTIAADPASIDPNFKHVYYPPVESDSNFTILPPPCPKAKMRIIGDSGPVGTAFVIQGSDWAPEGTVSVRLPYSSAELFGSQIANTNVPVRSNGSWQITETVLEQTPAGTYLFQATEPVPQCPGGQIEKSAQFIVTPPPMPNRSTPTPTPTPTPVSSAPAPSSTVPIAPAPVYSQPSGLTVPNLVGLTLDDARRALPAGLALGEVSGKDGTVIDQQPKPGQLVPPYTRVAVVLNAPGFPAWLAVLAVFALLGAGAALLAVQVIRRRMERRRWAGRIRVNAVPDFTPVIQLKGPDVAASATVRVEVHPDHGVQNVREVR